MRPLAPEGGVVRCKLLLIMSRVLLLCLLLALPAGGESWTLLVEPTEVRQGGLVFLELESPTTLGRPTCQWLGRTYRLYRVPGGYRTLLPVDRLQKTGPAELVLRVKGSHAPLARRRLSIVELDTRPSPESSGSGFHMLSSSGNAGTIRLKPDRMALQKDPRVKEQSKRIRQLLRTKSAVQLWKGNFQPPSSKPGRGFGRQRRYIEAQGSRRSGSGFRGYHRGLDFSLKPGTPVYAANAGKVLCAEPFVVPGNSVLLDHGHGVITAYFHMKEIQVKPGDRIARGQVIGTVGNTGRSTGPHLHWAVYAQGQAVNPVAITRLPKRFWSTPP